MFAFMYLDVMIEQQICDIQSVLVYSDCE